MGALITVFFYLSLAAMAYLSARRAGTWSWPMFAFVMGFMALEVLILCIPAMIGGTSRHFVPALIVTWVIAALNFIWFFILCRRWKPKPH